MGERVDDGINILLLRCSVIFYNWKAPSSSSSKLEGVRTIADRKVTAEGGENGWKRELERNGHLGSKITYLKVPKLTHLIRSLRKLRLRWTLRATRSRLSGAG